VLPDPAPDPSVHNGSGGATQWRQRGAWAAGLTLFAFETVQSVLLLPLLPLWMPIADVSLWISLTAGWGLVNAAASAYAQPLVRNVARRGPQAAVPGNWQRLRDKTDQAGVVLLVGPLSVFGAYLIWQVPRWSNSTTLAILLFFAAMGLKLLALNRFVWLNGMGQIGRDKNILLTGSATTLVCALVFAPHIAAVWGLALASLLGALVAATLATVAARRLGHNADGVSAEWPSRSEMRGLVLLNLCGYLNMATDVLMANHFLPAEQAVSYAFWSRILLSFCLLAGMYTQIRFPQWAQAQTRSLRVELAWALAAAATLPLWVSLMLAVVCISPWSGSPCLLPTWAFLSLAANGALCCAVLLCGQLANARGSFSFMAPSAWLAASAPLLALCAALVSQPTAFVLGYVLANSLLLALNARHTYAKLACRGTR
jgi:hypothetical protein